MANFRKKIQRKFKSVLIETGLNTHAPNDKGRQIIMYHGIDKSENRTYNSRFFSAKNLEAQLLVFKKKFEILSLEDYFNAKHETNKFKLAITFDDGYLNNYKYALPILEKLEIPATFFITGLDTTKHPIVWADYYDFGRIHTKLTTFRFNNELFTRKEKNQFYTSNGEKFGVYFRKDLRTMEVKMTELSEIFEPQLKGKLEDEKHHDYWKLMTEAEIKHCSESKYVNIGSHAFYHNNLGNISFDAAVIELRRSKEYLENICQKEINSIGYPDGSYTRELALLGEKLGYKYQCSAKYRFAEDKTTPFMEDRFGLYPLQNPESPNRLAYLIEKSAVK